ncbi:hypothetical protein DRN74_01665 [Candidatus Micrarchaeota archaeon]|nr:MAG: hypothetical protein DRN74_01665 [Candidatus Micrarchaeota archaeon]
MKAQLTLEYLIIFVILLLLFSNVSMDLMGSSMSSALQIQKQQIMKAANLSLESAASKLQYQGEGARILVKIRAAPDCNYIFEEKRAYAECRSGTYDIGPNPLPADLVYSEKTIKENELDVVEISKE